MPRATKTLSPVATGDHQRLTIVLRENDYLALQQMAREQYRTAELQAAWLLAKALSEAGRVTAPGTDHAARILERARSGGTAGANGS